MKKSLFFIIIFSILVRTITADDLANLLQDLAVQIACIGRYSVVQASKYVTSRYKDPPDWYDPPMMANRFAAMSGSMTRTITFYGVCFDYAQFAWNYINNNQKMFNNAGMKGKQWHIASTKANDPYTIILYDPSSKDTSTIIMNGIYLKENSRYKVYAHDGASGHAWIWVQDNNGTWYWIDPTWTDNTGYVWWGIVKDGREVRYDPDPKYCVASNYPKKGITNTGSGTNSTYIEKPKPVISNINSGDAYHVGLIGYNYLSEMPLGFKVGAFGFYVSMNLAFSEDSDFLRDYHASVSGIELINGYSFILIKNSLFLLFGVGLNFTERRYEVITGSWNYTDASGHHYDTEWESAIVLEIGIQPVVFNYFYLSATYRLIGFSRSGFSFGVGFIF